MESRASKLFKKVHLVKFRGKGCSNHFFETEGNSYYATTGYKILYSTYLVAQPNITNLYNFLFVLMLVCFSA